MRKRDFKRHWEKVAVDQFLEYLNRQEGKKRFAVAEHGDCPDFRCSDAAGNPWRVEVTLAFDDREGDPKRWQAIADGPRHEPIVGNPMTFAEAFPSLKQAITNKFGKRYGTNCALVVYNLARPWEWADEVERLARDIDYSVSPYDRGVWFLTSWGETYCLDTGRSAEPTPWTESPWFRQVQAMGGVDPGRTFPC